jgi:2-polyprenyl-3-methyl-5-hydroxy-6-metoxy-1,4-benzoquinol methylase
MRKIDKYTKDYLNHDFEDIQAFYRKKKIISILNKTQPKRILEVGCGMDSIANHYLEYDLFVVVEPSKKFLKEGIKKKTNKIIAINDFFEHSVKKLDSYKFDMIIVSGLLHEVNNVEILLTSLKKVIGTKTLIHINVPNANSLHKLLGVNMGILQTIFDNTEAHNRLQQNTIFDINKLKNLCEKYKLRVIEEGGYFVKPFSHGQMANILNTGIISEDTLDGLYKLSEIMPEFSSEIYVNARLDDEN